MIARVRLSPSNREFDVFPGETILDSALRAGLAPRYGCSNGVCGECLGELTARLGGLEQFDVYLAAPVSIAALLCEQLIEKGVQPGRLFTQFPHGRAN